MYKVLIVEDDPMVAMINEQYVCRHKSFSVVGKCKDGDKALKFINENRNTHRKETPTNNNNNFLVLFMLCF